MHYRKLGTTDVMISEVGMGCNRLGESHQPDKHWIALVQRAKDLGVNLFDTSERYGKGRSEEILGNAFGDDGGIYIATKMSRFRKAAANRFSVAEMIESAESSLKRLNRECIDIYQLHSPKREVLEHSDWVAGMEKLKEQGKIRFRAIAVRSIADAIWLIEQGWVDVLQITYNIFETEAAESLFTLAESNGIGLLCRMPLARGVLTGKFRPGQKISDEYRAYLDRDRVPARINQVESLRPIGKSYEGGLTRMALHYCLAPRAVLAVIPGARTIAQVEENVAASNGVGISPDLKSQIDMICRPTP